MIRILSLIFLLVSAKTFSQIQLADSTVQVITYFDKGEKELYQIEYERVKLKGTDTISKSKISYKVEIEVLEEEQDYYVIQWNFSEYQGIPTDLNSLASSALARSRVVIKTNEMGDIIDILNWEEIRDNNNKVYQLFDELFKNNKEMQEVLKQFKTLSNSPDFVKNVACKDVLQFHYFFGTKLTMGETIEGEIEVANNYGGPPFIADVIFYLQSIISEQDTYVVRAIQEVSGEQLSKAVFDLLTKLNPSLLNEPLPENFFESLKNEIETATAFHNTGWPLYSIQTVTVSFNTDTLIEQRTIEWIDKE